MEVHPDRVADRPAVEQAGAARTMAELNEAFATLSDPARRHRYDHEQAADAPRPPGSARPTGAAGSQTGSEPPWRPVDDDLVDVVPAGPLAVLMSYAPWLALVGLLVGIFIFTAYADGGPGEDDPSAPGGTVAVREMRGSCIKTSGGFVLVANCAQTPHQGEIVAQAGDASLCPEGTVAWEVPQEDVVACTDPATAVE